MKELFPTARQVLDYYHCSKHVHEIALAQWSEMPQKALEWVEAMMAQLFLGEVESVLGSLKQIKASGKEAQKAINRLWQYLKRNQDRVKYGAYRKGGYPIGSGAIESAHRFICHVRLKRPGAWWYMKRDNGMLALRCAKYNGTFNRVFKRYVCHDQQQKFGNSAKFT